MGSCASQNPAAPGPAAGAAAGKPPPAAGGAAQPGGRQHNGVPSNARREEAVPKIELTDAVITQYVDLEKEIYRLEKKNVVKKYEAKTLHADELKKTCDQLEATYKELKKQTEKEKADVENIEQPSVRAFLKQQGTYDDKFNKEQTQYLDCLNKQEVAEKELKGAKAQYERAARIAEIYKQRADRLADQYEKQDKLLAGIFGGQYGSELENKLEGELDDAMEWQQRVALAKFKWTNARVLLVHALTQMAFGIKRWRELETIELSNTRMRYFAAAEARNNFVAASQNIQSAKVYLGKVQFPYCTPDEMQNLEQSINNAFTDIQSNDKYQKSLEVYQFTHKKVAALIQWFDQVISQTILKDLEGANNEVGQLHKGLREERLRLIREKAKGTLGKDVKIEYDNVTDDDEKDEELLALEADRVKDGDDLKGEKLTRLLNMSQPDGGRAPSPLPAGQLAPLPTNESLFGNIASMRKEHEKERTELQKQQEVAKIKNEQGLQAKLAQRRTRKERKTKKKEAKEGAAAGAADGAAPAPKPK